MLNLAVNGYTREQIVTQLHGRSGSRGLVKFRYDLLNKHDIKIGELAVQAGSVALDSLAEIKRTAEFTVKEQEGNDIDWLSDRIQPVFCLRMLDGGFAEWPVGVFLIASPTRKDHGKMVKRDIEAYDTSLILVEDCFDNRYRIAAGTKYVTAITSILNGAGIWKINIADHPGTIGSDKEFEIGTTKLQAVNQLLYEINYTTLWVDENGYSIAQPYILPSGRESEYDYRNNDLSIIHPGSVQEEDLFAVPNKWIRVVSNPEKAPLVSRYTNDLPTSKTSTINRGRVIVDYETVDDIYDQTTLDDYTKRSAYEASQIYGKFDFSTALMPHHSFCNCLFIEHSRFGIANKYMESSWEMELRAGGNMTHSCRRVMHI